MVRIADSPGGRRVYPNEGSTDSEIQTARTLVRFENRMSRPAWLPQTGNVWPWFAPIQAVHTPRLGSCLLVLYAFLGIR